MPSFFPSLIALILCLAIFYLGAFILRLFPFLARLNLPTAVVGALAFIPLLKGSEAFFIFELQIPSGLRDLLLVVFFCSMGLAVKSGEAIEGGRALLLLCILSFILVLLQNLTGVALALFFGLHPAYGLLAGSISYVGGFGSSLAWGTYFSENGLPFALEIGFACSTFGLLSGGLLAGPAAAWLIKRYNLAEQAAASDSALNLDQIAETTQTDSLKAPLHAASARAASIWAVSVWINAFKTFLAVLVSIGFADLIDPFLRASGIALPRFLIAMLIAIILANSTSRIEKIAIPRYATDKLSEFSFNAFIIISLISMKIAGLSEYLLPIIIILMAQILITVLFSTQILYRVMGRGYQAAVLAGGVIGFGLSSLAVAVATVKTIIKNHGPEPRALLLTSLVGAALIDLPNNLLIGFLTRFSFFSF